jgi:hypothetical protein
VFFGKIKKTKFLERIWGFYACSGFPSWDARSESLFFELVCVFWENKKDKILGKNLGFLCLLRIS